MTEFLWLLGAYLAGTIPTAYLVARWAKGVDIRTVGSGNIGATNVFRVVGKTAGFFTLAVDVLKGFLPVFLCLHYYGDGLLPVGVGLAAVLGHGASPWVGFWGGKGVATSCGVFLALMPGPMAVCLGVFLLAFVVTKRVSVGSILAAATLPIAAHAMHADVWRISLGAVLALFVLVKHRGNMRRIVRGEEPAVTFSRKVDSNG